MSKLKIDKIINFDKFLNLKYLWLNNNRIKSIDNLKNNKCLIELYLHNN